MLIFITLKQGNVTTKMCLTERLITVALRENAGARTPNRYDYQKNWALTKLLELHLSDNDYVLILEYQDDVVLLDSEENPREISFFQVKTTDKSHWVPSDLVKQTRREGRLLNSILGKLYLNKQNFPNQTRSLNLVSNKNFSLKLANSSNGNSLGRESICITELEAEAIVYIKQNLRQEHSLTNDPEIDHIMYFLVSDLSLEDQMNHTIGKLVSFLGRVFPEDVFLITYVYRVIFDEIKRKNDYVTEGQLTFRDLLSQKSITRRDFDSILQTIRRRRISVNNWETIKQYLINDNYPCAELIHIADRWITCGIDRLDPSNQVVKRLISDIRTALTKIDTSNCSVRNILEETFSFLIKEAKLDLINDHYYVKAMILMEYTA